MAISSLSKVQKERIKRLEPALKEAAANGNLSLAKQIVVDLKGIYLATGNSAKFGLAKNRLFEAAMEAGELTFAIEGLEGIRKSCNNNTRVYLEATTLLAICYLRKNILSETEPLITEVLTNDHVIKSPEKRTEFRKLVIERFNEETTLRSLKSDVVDEYTLEEIEATAINMANSNSETEIYKNIGQFVPDSTKNILSKVDAFSKKQLPSAQRLMLNAPITPADAEEIGKTVYASIKRVVYGSLCDKKNSNYKSWHGSSATALKTGVTVVVAEVFSKFSIGMKAVLVSVIAIILKLGIEIYCDFNKPINVMSIR